MGHEADLAGIIATYRTDPESVYNTWFVNNAARLKAFGAIKRGVKQVVDDIREGTFPADFKGSSLEVVLAAITEQKQVFEGAAHAFYWKPKLRIPDIYENETNKRAFGQFLHVCLATDREDILLREILQLRDRGIKGLGPAVANILYFLHPMLIPPSNTAMVRGFNILFDGQIKLGSWDSYLDMRDAIVHVSETHKQVLSKDLGASSGLLFDVGVGKIVIDGERQAKLPGVAKATQRRHEDVQSTRKEESAHTQLQYQLVKMGRALDYDVVVASNDRSNSCAGESFSFLTLSRLPDLGLTETVARTVELIDVLWLSKDDIKVVCAFEIENSTSIYSGMLRMMDLASELPGTDPVVLYLVAPDEREKEVRAQLDRPSLKAQANLEVLYLLYSDLCRHCDSICQLGQDHTILTRLARRM